MCIYNEGLLNNLRLTDNDVAVTLVSLIKLTPLTEWGHCNSNATMTSSSLHTPTLHSSLHNRLPSAFHKSLMYLQKTGLFVPWTTVLKLWIVGFHFPVTSLLWLFSLHLGHWQPLWMRAETKNDGLYTPTSVLIIDFTFGRKCETK